jgi:hypothetical protein
MRSQFDVFDPRPTSGFEDELYGRFVESLRDRGWVA